MLALSTSCAPADLPLDRVLSSFRHLDVAAAVLHRPPEPEEARAIAALAKLVRVVALFGEAPHADAGAKLLVIEGGEASEDRERSLEALCRRLHAHRLGGYRVALRTPRSEGEHPSPSEIGMVCDSVRHAGYWHDLSRGGGAYLDAAERHLLGASFDPRVHEDLIGLRDALPASAPATLWLESSAPRAEVAALIERSRGIFRG